MEEENNNSTDSSGNSSSGEVESDTEESVTESEEDKQADSEDLEEDEELGKVDGGEEKKSDSEEDPKTDNGGDKKTDDGEEGGDDVDFSQFLKIDNVGEGGGGVDFSQFLKMNKIERRRNSFLWGLAEKKEKDVNFDTVMKRIRKLEDIFRYKHHQRLDKVDMIPCFGRICCSFTGSCISCVIITIVLIVVLFIGYYQYATQHVLTRVENFHQDDIKFPRVGICVEVDGHYVESIDFHIQRSNFMNHGEVVFRLPHTTFMIAPEENGVTYETECVVFGGLGDIYGEFGGRMLISLSFDWEGLEKPLSGYLMLISGTFEDEESLKEHISTNISSTGIYFSPCQDCGVLFEERLYEKYGDETISNFEGTISSQVFTWGYGSSLCNGNQMLVKPVTDSILKVVEYKERTLLTPIETFGAYLSLVLSVTALIRTCQMCSCNWIQKQVWQFVRTQFRKGQIIKKANLEGKGNKPLIPPAVRRIREQREINRKNNE